MLNAIGTGVADDNAVHPHLPHHVPIFCGEEPLVPDVPQHDLEDPAVRETALGRAAELVLKPRDGHGGHGVVIGPRADPAELDAAVAAARAAPGGWIAQDLVTLSSHPTVVGDALVPRHVDLRPFAVADGAGGWTLLPGGLTRVALQEGELVVNSSRGGGGKDTWVLR
jgi:carboxylate-amine ligase